VTLHEFEGKRPRVADSAFVAPGAHLIGDVLVAESASVWFGAVLRADLARIDLHEGVNVQDGSIIHAGPEPVVVESGATIGHGCVVHCLRVETGALVGNGAVLLDGAVVGAGAIIAAGSVVTPKTHIPPFSLALGSPARVVGPLDEAARQMTVRTADIYRDLTRRYSVSFRHPGGDDIELDAVEQHESASRRRSRGGIGKRSITWISRRWR
jgi:carbonic anhydrase/acetyltransferase-like protein (isoleucine patch superfamily)